MIYASTIRATVAQWNRRVGKSQTRMARPRVSVAPGSICAITAAALWIHAPPRLDTATIQPGQRPSLPPAYSSNELFWRSFSGFVLHSNPLNLGRISYGAAADQGAGA